MVTHCNVKETALRFASFESDMKQAQYEMFSFFYTSFEASVSNVTSLAFITLRVLAALRSHSLFPLLILV